MSIMEIIDQDTKEKHDCMLLLFLECMPHILENTLSYLPLLDLKRFSQVSMKLKQLADEVWSKRATKAGDIETVCALLDNGIAIEQGALLSTLPLLTDISNSSDCFYKKKPDLKLYYAVMDTT